MDPGMRDNSSNVEETLNEKRGLYGDVLGKWRSCEQVDNGTPSTSPSYEDSEDDDGTKPSALYNKFTWKIEKFSTIDTRELRSPAYDAGGYKWYILIYPQGCDVSNHLSLFLCVANHDKFLPGWSHFAQFTIAVVNKDINKSKYSDTLHRFWKKEHDWGWKKFMELSKLPDGFIIDDTLVIDAQVQVIRENAHRPFRCLDHEYRRELVRVYSSNVEQICQRFFEDRRGRLNKLIENKLRWPSFRLFWLGINQNVRRRMSRDTTEAILKLVVKHFFIEKEVTSTLVMDSLYYGLRALEGQSLQTKDGKSGGGGKPAVMVESQVPMVCIEKDMFVLAADVLLLLERAALAPHQPLLLKDEKASHNRTKDGSSGEEFYKDIIERDERRFTELGLRTLELFILIHIFSRIEVAYNEVIALKRQEALIREEEAAGQLENELRAKRLASEKEKRTKKKQAKQKRNARKGKDRGKDEKPETGIQKYHTSGPSNGKILDHEKTVAGKIETREDASDDGSDAGDDAPESLKPEIEVHLAVSHEIQNGVEREKRIISPAIDDNCSTCSTGSASSIAIVMNGAHKGISSPSDKRRTSRIRAKDHTREQICSTHGGNNPSSDSASAENSLVSQTEPEAAAVVSKDRIHHPAEKEEKEVETIIRDRLQEELLSKSKISPPSPAKKPPSALQQSKKSLETTTTTFATAHEPLSITPAQNEKSAPQATKSPPPTTATTTTTKTSYVQEEKEVETIIRDRLQEELLSKSRISPPSPAKKPPSAPQQSKKSSETTTTTFSTTHEPVSSTPAQNEKSAPLATKSPPPTTTTKTSYVQEEKEVETIIRDRLQEELLSKSRISPPSPAKKPSSAPQQPKKSSETTTITFATTHEPVSSTPAQNEKSVPLGTKSSPPTTATTSTTATKTEAKKLTTSLPRPSSAPLVASPRPAAPIVSTVQTSPHLSRSVSLAARLGTDPPTAPPASLPQSARNPVSSTTSGSGPLTCSTSSTETTSYPQSPSRIRNPFPNSRHGLGPALPESPAGLRAGLSVQLATEGEVSDEFPHLDIINDLLDEDQTAGMKSQFRPYFERQYTFPRDVSATSDIGSSGEGFRGPHGFSGGGPLNGPRDSQMEPSVYAGGRIDGARRTRWPHRASVLNSSGEDDDGNPYQTRDYGNGYNMF